MAIEKDPFQDMKDQFKGMKESLEEIAKHTKPVEEAAKAEITHHHKTRNKEVVAKVDLGKQTKKEILDSLRKIREQIVVTQHRESTMADVAAEALASGKGLAGAAREALTFKKDKLKASFKRKFDPLNIVHRITGGSKLAIVLAGKVMGRSEQSIRSAAGLQPLSEPAPTATPFMGDQGAAPSPVTSDQNTDLLRGIATTLTEIREHLTNLTQTNKTIGEGIEKQTSELEEMNDAEKDAASIAAVESEAPVQMVAGKEMTKKKEEGSSWLGAIAKMLGPAMLPLLAAFGLLVTSAILVYKNFDKIKLSFIMLGETIGELWQSIKDFVANIGTKISETITSVSDKIIDAGESLMDGVKSLVGLGQTDEEKRKDLETRAAAGDEYAQRKLVRLGATPAQTTASLDKLAPQFSGNLMSKNLPSDKLAAEAQELRKGGYVEDATKSLMGEKAITGSPERVAIGGALTQMVAKSYGELHKDKDGKPLTPYKDKDNAAKFLPPLIQEASMKLADSITSPTATGAAPLSMSKPIEIPPPAPTSGQTLSQAADTQRNVAMASPGGGLGGGGSTIINNVKNNNTNSSTVHQNMAPARSGESSYLRSLDSAHARS